MQISVHEHLAKYREQHGEEAWKSEVRRLALAGIRMGAKHEAFWKDLTQDLEWLNFEELKMHAVSEQIPSAPDQMMAEMLRKQMPGIKTQAQYDAVVGALDAVRLVVTAILSRDVAQESQARKVLETAFEAARAATEIHQRIEDTPEAATSPQSEQFKKPPAQFQERDISERLLADLAEIQSIEGLNAWYASTKADRDRIVTQSLRNGLLDAIRAKKSSL